MKPSVLVVTLAILVAESTAITVVDNTNQHLAVEDVSRRRPLLSIRDNLQQVRQPSQETQVVAETKSDLMKGFRSVVVHRPGNVDGQGGLTVQDPPKGWPFSEMQVKFNSHLSEDDYKDSPEIITFHSDNNRIVNDGSRQNRQHSFFRKKQHQQQLKLPSQHQQYQLQPPYQNQPQQELYQNQIQQHQQSQLQQQYQNQLVQQHENQYQNQQQNQQQYQNQLQQQHQNHLQRHTQQYQTQVNVDQEKQTAQQNFNFAQQQQQQQQNTIKQQLHPNQQVALYQPHQIPSPVLSSSEQLQNNFNKKNVPQKFIIKVPPSLTTTSATDQYPLNTVPGTVDGKTTNQQQARNPKLRRPNSGLHTGYNIGFVAPADSFSHSNNMLNVINNELATSGTQLLGENSNDFREHHSNTQQSPQIIPVKPNTEQSKGHHSSQVIHARPNNENLNKHQATSSASFQQNKDSDNDHNYVWREVGKGLEISSNIPQNSLVKHETTPSSTPTSHIGTSLNNVVNGVHSSTAATIITKPNNEEQKNVFNYALGAQTHGNQVGQLQGFDHANALGHSDNFGYRDAISYPSLIQTETRQGHFESANPQGNSLKDGPVLNGNSQEQTVQYYNSIYQTPPALHNPGKGNSKISNAHSEFKKGLVIPGENNGQGIYKPYHQQQQQQKQQQQQQQQLQPQSYSGVNGNGQKVIFKVNKGIIQGVPGSFVVGNGIHVGYTAANSGQQNVLLAPQGIVNTGGQGNPVQTLYIPLPGLQNEHHGNTQIHSSRTGGNSGNVPSTISGQTGSYGSLPVTQGAINTGTFPYLPLLNTDYQGLTNTGGFPLLQGGLVGVKGLPGVGGGIAYQSGHAGSILIGDNKISSPNTGLPSASQQNLQSTGLQVQYNAPIAGTQPLPSITGNELFNYYNTVPYLQQQAGYQPNQIALQQDNNFGVKIQHQHPVQNQILKTGVQTKAPVSGIQPPHIITYNSQYSIQPTIPNNGNRGGYQLSSSQHNQPIIDSSKHQSDHKLNSLFSPPIKQQPSNIVQQTAYPQNPVKRDGHINRVSIIPKLGPPLKEKGMQGRIISSIKQGKPVGPHGKSVLAQPHVIMRAPNTRLSLIK